MIAVDVRVFVRARADNQCEYCRLPQSATPLFTFHIEHVVAHQHGGTDEATNLCLACPGCNRFKGPNLTTIDQATQAIIRLFNPRIDRWDQHFQLLDGRIVGLTPVGDATARLLQFNTEERVRLRRELVQYGEYA